MHTKSKKLGIVIPFFEGDEYILPCISSILAEKFTDGPLSIYVVDNNDEESKLLKKAFDHNVVKVRKVNAAMGYGRACNLGVEWAVEDNCEYLMLLNQDTLLGKGTLSKIYRALSTHDVEHVFSPIIFEYDFEYISMALVRRYLSANPAYFTDALRGQIKEQYELPNIGAVCIALHKQLVSRIGLFDPVFHQYGEDYDFFRRLQRHNGKLYLLPEAKIAHQGGVNSLSDVSKSIGSLRYMQAQVIKKIRYDSKLAALNKALFYLRICLFRGNIKTTTTFLVMLWEILGRYTLIIDNTTESVKKRMQNQCLLDSSADNLG